MALFNDIFAQTLMNRVYERHQTLGTALGKPMEQATLGPWDEQSPLYHHLQVLIRIANGEYTRGNASATLVRRVEVALTSVLTILLGNALQVNTPIPDTFWDTDIGTLVSRVRWWLSVDDLITISNAAALAFGTNTQANRMRIVRAIDSGLLDWVPDPSVANRQHNRRVLLPQVERLRDQRRLPP